MNNIKKIDIYTNYFWTIKILNKNSFIKNIFNFTDEDKLLSLINDELAKINQTSLLNNQTLFSLNSQNEVVNKIDINDNLYYKYNNKDQKYTYSFRINLNSNYAANSFITCFDQIVVFDLDTYFVNGGVSWKFNNDWNKKFFQTDKYENLDNEFVNLSAIYLNNLIKNFFLELLAKFSFMDFVNLLNEKNLKNLHRLHIYTQSIYTIDTLYEQWTSYIYQQFFNKFYENIESFKEISIQMFDFFCLMFLSAFAVGEHLRRVFYNNNSNLSYKNWEHDNNSINAAVTNCANFLFNENKAIFTKKEDYINIVAGLTRDNVFLSLPNVTYDISLDAQDSLFTKDFYLYKKDIYLYSILLLYPDMFNIAHDSCLKMTYDNFYDNVKRFFYNESILSEQFTNRIRKNLLLENYDYCSFMRKNNTLIFHTSDLSEKENNTILRNNAVIDSVALGKELNFKLIYTQWKLGIECASIKNKFLYRQVTQETNDLIQPSNLEKVNNSFKESIIHYDKHLHLNSNVKFLNQEVKIKDEFDKRQRFIEIIILGFIVASIISLVDYGNMVWSTLSCSSSFNGAPLWGATPNPIDPNKYPGNMIPMWQSGLGVGFNTFLILINTIILLVSLGYLIYAHKKNKDIANRKDTKL